VSLQWVQRNLTNCLALFLLSSASLPSTPSYVFASLLFPLRCLFTAHTRMWWLTIFFFSSVLLKFSHPKKVRHPSVPLFLSAWKPNGAIEASSHLAPSARSTEPSDVGLGPFFFWNFIPQTFFDAGLPFFCPMASTHCHNAEY